MVFCEEPPRFVFILRVLSYEYRLFKTQCISTQTHSFSLVYLQVSEHRRGGCLESDPENVVTVQRVRGSRCFVDCTCCKYGCLFQPSYLTTPEIWCSPYVSSCSVPLRIVFALSKTFIIFPSMKFLCSLQFVSTSELPVIWCFCFG